MSEKSKGWAKIEELLEKRLENSSKTAGPSGCLGVCVCVWVCQECVLCVNATFDGVTSTKEKICMLVQTAAWSRDICSLLKGPRAPSANEVRGGEF